MGKGQNESGMAEATHADVASAIPDFNSLPFCQQTYSPDTIANQ
jgi:hypothetical protein